MWNSLTKILTTPSLRVATITLFCLGFTYASTLPYQSILVTLAIGAVGFAAAVFASAETVIGFSGAAWFGVIVTLGGCLLLYSLDSKGGSHARSLL